MHLTRQLLRLAALPDLNVWLALASPTHQHHSSAVRYGEEQASQQVLFCTVTALGLVRLVMQPKVMGDAALTAADASTTHNRPARAGMCSMA